MTQVIISFPCSFTVHHLQGELFDPSQMAQLLSVNESFMRPLHSKLSILTGFSFFPAWVVSSVWKAISVSIPGKPTSKSCKMQHSPGGAVDESTCQCRGHGFDPWSGRISHAVEQLSPRATTAKAHVLWGLRAPANEPLCCNY